MENKFTRVCLWIGAVGFVLFGAVFFPSLASLLFLLAACLVVPLPKVRDFWNSRGLRGKGHFLLALAVYVAALIAIPKDAPEVPEADEPPAITAEDTEAEPEPESITADDTPIVKHYEYDALQSMFMRLSLDTTMEQFQTIVEESGLPYTKQEYNTMGNERSERGKFVYQIAFTEGAALQRYSDPGDYVTVSFGKTTSNFMKASYSKQGLLGYTALLYSFGNWYDMNSEPGYYIVVSGGAKNQYEKYDSAESAIQTIIDKWQEKQGSNTQTTLETASAVN